MNHKARVATLFILAALVAPVVVYLRVFGMNISSNHSHWAEFGSAIGGIYSPFVALLTLFVLLKQVELQSQMNVHESDQAYLQQAREDVEFYSTQMAQVLGSTIHQGRTLRAVLQENFAHPVAAELDTQRLRQLSADLHRLSPSAFDMWASIYPILMGLEAGKTSMYTMTHASSTQKLIALLSFETCAALDHFHRVRTEGRLQVKYVFSPLLAVN